MSSVASASRRLLVSASVFCAAALLLAGGLATRVERDPRPVTVLPASGERIVYPAGSRPSIALPDGGSMPVRSVLNIRKSMHYGDFVWNDANVQPGPTWVLVDLRRQLLTAFRSGHEIGTAVILYGAQSKPTPAGTFHILQKAEHYASQTYDAPMPFMLRLTGDGVAIHASNVRRRAATHGCIGVPGDFARRLYGAVGVGDVVVVVGSGGHEPTTESVKVNRPLTKLANQAA
jgi:hypothetical protein